MSTLPYSKAATPKDRPYDAQFRTTPSIPILKRRLSIVAQTQDHNNLGNDVHTSVTNNPNHTRSNTSSSNTTLTKLRIQTSLPLVESTIGSLIEGLSKFTATPQLAQNVIDADAELSVALDELLEHQEAGKTIQKLKKISSDLDSQLNRVLVSLSESRRELQSGLKGVDSENDSDSSPMISASNLLSYATKITKFTHAPPGYNPEVSNEHANFPWPTEDGLRRGVLAMSALEADKEEARFKQEQKQKQPEGDDQKENQQSELKNNIPETKSLSPSQEFDPRQRRSSVVSYGERPVITNPSASSPQSQQQSISPSSPTNTGALDLDLFDPDEEEDDDEE